MRDDIEALRQAILDEIYAGAVIGGFPAMLIDEDAARCASPEELKEAARRYGLC